jgi:hypothetical protein
MTECLCLVSFNILEGLRPIARSAGEQRDIDRERAEAAKAVGVTNESPFLFDLWSRAARCYGVATYQSASTTVSGDLGGYRPLNVPMTQMIQSGTFYHASGDVLEAVPAEGLERAARFHAYFLEQVDRADERLIAAGKGSPYQSAIKGCQ